MGEDDLFGTNQDGFPSMGVAGNLDSRRDVFIEDGEDLAVVTSRRLMW